MIWQESYEAFLRHGEYFEDESEFQQIMSMDTKFINELPEPLRNAAIAVLETWSRDDFIEFEGFKIGLELGAKALKSC